jgi:beta-glucanase (GH16 family)
VRNTSSLWLLAAVPTILGGLLLSESRASIVTDNPAAWNLSFSDEFNGSALDSAKWAHRAPGPRKGGFNTPSAIAVGGGLLTISTYTDAGTHYTGMISTQGKFEQTYGYYETRMKFQSAPGQWSAFWLQSPAYGGVGNPGLYGTEIDVVEYRATNRNGLNILDRYNTAIHWDGYEDDHQQTAKVHQNVPGLENGSWHTFGLKWSSSGYEFYYDDQLMWTATEAISMRPEYMILSSEVESGGWAGTVPATGYGSLATTTTNVQVDYVRVWSAVTPPAESADFDSDGDVDGADFLTWQRGAGTTVGAVRVNGNANAGFDGDVDEGDLEVWRVQFGSAAATNVPEPGAWMLVAASAAGLFGYAGRSRRRN